MTPAAPRMITPRGFVLFGRSPMFWAAILGGWLLLSLVLAPEVYIYSLYRRQPIPWNEVIVLTVANALIAAFFTPPIVWLTGRFHFEKGKWMRSLLVHIPACLAFSVSHSSLYTMLCYASPELSHILFLRFHPNVITYGAIVGITEAVTYFTKYQERERQLAQAQLQLLKMQLHPHFLFNTLHTISAMIHEDVKGADRMISRLSDLLRLTLDHIGQHEVPLREEIEFLEKYLEIERTRFEEHLSLDLQVDPHVLDALVPSMLLQPLVENSIRHGFGARQASGVITVSAGRREGHLELIVADNGTGLNGNRSGRPPEGLGLANTRQRLEQLYPASHRFHLGDGARGGTVVSIQIPYHAVGPSAEPSATRAPTREEDANCDR